LRDMKSSCKKPRTSQRLLEVPTVVQLIPNAIALGQTRHPAPYRNLEAYTVGTSRISSQNTRISYCQH